MAGIGNLGVFGDFGGEDEKLRKKSQLEGTSGELFASNEPLTVKIGSGVWSVGLTMMGKKGKAKAQSGAKWGMRISGVGGPINTKFLWKVAPMDLVKNVKFHRDRPSGFCFIAVEAPH